VKIPVLGSRGTLAAGFLIAILALALRLIHLLQIQSSPFALALVGDGRQYDLIAQEIAGGSWFGTTVFYQAPLYPYFLAMIYSLAGHDLIVVKLVQIAIGTAACVLLFDAGRLFFGLRAGIIAGLLLAVYAPAIHFDLLIQKTVFDVALLVLLIALLGRFTLRPRFGTVFASGVVFALLSLSRENALILFFVIIPWILIHFRGHRRSAWRWVLVFTVGAAVLLGPVAARNYYVGGEFALTTSQFGSNFYLGNNPHTDGRYLPLRPDRGDARYERQDAIEIAQEVEGRKLSPSEVSRFWLGESLDYIRSDPGDWLRLLWQKFKLFWNAGEVVDTEAVEAYREHSLVLRLLQPFHFGLICPLALFGMIFIGARWRQHWILYALMIALALSVILFFIFARYRQPVVPILMLFAAAGIAHLWFLRRSLRSPRLWVALLIAGLTALWVNQPYPHSAEQRAISYYAVGASLLETGRPGEAVPCFREALRSKPDFGEARKNLSMALTQEGKNREAIKELREAARLNPSDADILTSLGLLLYQEQAFDEAAQLFSAALKLDPDRAAALSNLGAALIAQERYEEALEPLTRSVQLQPESSPAHFNLGSALFRLGRFQEAERHLDAAIRLDARNAGAHILRGYLKEELGDFGAAAAAYRRALELRPTHAEVRRRLEALQLRLREAEDF
jgi:tetratricopeptide (TPR) repeat protein